jgi:acetyl-CoA acetyltransferase
VILASARTKGRLARAAPRVQASLLVQPDGRRDGAGRAARLAYEATGLGPEDLDCVELEDVTAAAELVAYEDLQLAPLGQGPELIDSGFTALGGVLPVNTSGGLLSLGELPGASGLSQICQITRQLRGEAGAAQVAGARVGLAQSGGHAGEGDGLVALTILTG